MKEDLAAASAVGGHISSPLAGTPPSAPPTTQPCPACAGAAPAIVTSTPSHVYAIGRIEPRFPLLSVEKEFAQATGRAETKALTDRQALHNVLAQQENQYLVRQLCWVMAIQGIDTYIVVPRNSADLSLLVETLRASPNPMDLDMIIGIKGPLAPPQMCNGLTVPVVVFDQVYSFHREALIKAIPRPESIPKKEFGAAAEELFDRIMQMTDNAGATDEHRALNYLAVRYHAIYAHAVDAFARNCALTSLGVRPSALSSTRRIVEVIFSYTNRSTDVADKVFTRVDVTEEFPFLVTKLSPYYDR